MIEEMWYKRAMSLHSFIQFIILNMQVQWPYGVARKKAINQDLDLQLGDFTMYR